MTNTGSFEQFLFEKMDELDVPQENPIEHVTCSGGLTLETPGGGD